MFRYLSGGSNGMRLYFGMQWRCTAEEYPRDQDQLKYLGRKFYKGDAFEREMERSNPHLTTFDPM